MIETSDNKEQIEEKKAYVHIEVIDSGIGIKEEDLPKLFKTFSQITTVEHPKSEGTGLGLVISKKIIDLHKGKIWVQSSWGKGSTFHILLPAVILQFPQMTLLYYDKSVKCILNGLLQCIYNFGRLIWFV